MSDPLNDPHLLKWAECFDNRVAITEFWEWLLQRSDLVQHSIDPVPADLVELGELNIEKLLDQYFEIDKTELERASRALLAACDSMPVVVVDAMQPNPVS